MNTYIINIKSEECDKSDNYYIATDIQRIIRHKQKDLTKC